MDFKVQTSIRVRFADVDAMGHVNNAKFFTYMEQGRMNYFRRFPDLDFTRGHPGEGISLILAKIQCQFLSPALMDEELIVRLATTEIRRSSFSMEYEINEASSGRAVAKGESVQVYYDYAAKRSLEIPAELRKRFEELEGRKFEAKP